MTYSGYTPEPTYDSKLLAILSRLTDAAGLVKACEIAYIACEFCEDGNTPELIRELDYQTRMAENAKIEAELRWDQFASEWGDEFVRAERLIVGGLR